MWTEGQEFVQTTVTKYERNVFNLFGGDTGFEDWLSGDNSYVWQTIEFHRRAAAARIGGTVRPTRARRCRPTPPATTTPISYERLADTDVDVFTGVTRVLRVEGSGTGGVAVPCTSGSTERGRAVLLNQDYGDTNFWEAAAVQAGDVDYNSDFLNSTITPRQWETGGGWLRTKTYHTEVTGVQGQKDYYSTR